MDFSAVETALTRLHALALENPALQEACQFYQRLIPTMNELRNQVPAISIDPILLRQKISAGTPLLVGERLEFNEALTRHIFLAICNVVEDMPGADPNAAQDATRQNARGILRAVDSGSLDPLSLITAGGGGKTEAVEAIAARLSLDPPLLALVTQNTLKVFLQSWRSALEGQVDLNEWRRAPCPFCGADAGLAEIRGVESARYLRCLRCGAGWPYPHLCCAFCGNEDHQTLGVLLVEERVEKPYLHICDRCQRYIKTVKCFEPIPLDMLIVTDLTTLSLDRLAAERGYR